MKLLKYIISKVKLYNKVRKFNSDQKIRLKQAICIAYSSDAPMSWSNLKAINEALGVYIELKISHNFYNASPEQIISAVKYWGT
jgi:NADH:ubiquinone oxidoreductase subunit E